MHSYPAKYFELSYYDGSHMVRNKMYPTSGSSQELLFLTIVTVISNPIEKLSCSFNLQTNDYYKHFKEHDNCSDVQMFPWIDDQCFNFSSGF